MNFNCVFSDCDYKKNNVSEEEFLIHLSDVHQHDVDKIAKKENIPVDMARMMIVSNSKVFINS